MRNEQEPRKAESDQNSGNNQKVDMEVEKDEAVSDAKGKSMDVVCFNCGEIGAL